MPTFDWQTLIALVCVAIAAALIVRRVWSFLHPVSGGCGGGCVGCGSAAGASSGEMVTLSLPPTAETHRGA